MKQHSKTAHILSGLAGLALALSLSGCTEQARAKPNLVEKDAPRPGVVAKIGGQEITEEELIGEDKLEFIELKKREYDFKIDRLNKLMVDRLIGAEAKKANMSLDDYIVKNIAKGEIKIGDKELKKFIADKRIPESQLNPQIKERITNFLQAQKRQELVQAHLAKLTKSNPVEVYFTKPKLSIKVEVGNSPSYGKESAPVTIVEFSDFQCPFCARGADVVNEIKKKYGESKVRIAFKQFPLPMHKDAEPASQASLCVNEQNTGKFWKYHDLLFKNQDKLDAASLEKFAGDVGADVKKFKECFDSKKYAAAVREDMEYGEKLGVRSTPTFFVNGQLLSGALPIEQFSEIIDEELAAAKK